MSRTYYLICLDHNPAIFVDHNDSWNLREEAVQAALDRTGPVAAHPHCTLLVACFSGGLIEIGCPRSIGEYTPGAHRHSTDQWIAVGWLRLLFLAPSEARAAAGLDEGCWAHRRIASLRELVFEGAPGGTPDTPT